LIINVLCNKFCSDGFIRRVDALKQPTAIEIAATA
jgi:hypothetical protein